MGTRLALLNEYITERAEIGDIEHSPRVDVADFTRSNAPLGSAEPVFAGRDASLGVHISDELFDCRFNLRAARTCHTSGTFPTEMTRSLMTLTTRFSPSQHQRYRHQ
jgi:hypothetical protein